MPSIPPYKVLWLHSPNSPARWWASETSTIQYAGARHSRHRRLHPHPAGNRAVGFRHRSSCCSIPCSTKRTARRLWAESLCSARSPPFSPPCTSRNSRASAFWDMVRVDSFSVFFHFLIIAIAVVVILTSYEYMAVQQIRAGEYYALILFGAVGMSLMSSAVELVLIFIALEISSISTYILAGFRRRGCDQQRIVAEVFPAGLVCHRVFSLRRRPDVRRDRLHQHPSNRRHVAVGSGAVAGLRRRRLDVRGTRLQSGSRALPHLDARCLRRRSGTRRRLHVHCAQSGGVRSSAAYHVRGPMRPDASG